MKNKEFYKEKIKIYDENFCKNFINRYVLPDYNMSCNHLPCSQCNMLSAMWLDEEYKDLDKEKNIQNKMIEKLKNLSIDTPVYVRNNKRSEWVVRYLKKVNVEEKCPFECFVNGTTSITEKRTEHWKYAKIFNKNTLEIKEKGGICYNAKEINGNMRFNIGDKVIVEDWKYLHDHRLGSTEHESFKGGDITGDILILYCGDTVTIANVIGDRYTVVEDDEEYLWMDEMFV